MSIIKRRKTVDYLQLHNYPVQKDLEDLAAIGLLTYIMSLPQDWELHKTQLQKKFSRRKVDGAWKILVEKKYAIGFICYADRKKTYHYNVSDIPFTEEEYFQFANDTLEELLKEHESVSSIKEIPDSPYKIYQVQDEIPEGITTAQIEQYTIAQIEQYKKYSTIYTVLNVQIQKKYITKEISTKETQTKEIDFVNNIVNKKLEESINNLIKEYMVKGLSKNLCFRLLNEILPRENQIDNFGGYFRTCLETTLYRVKVKTGEIELNPKFEAAVERMKAQGIPIYDWLNN